MESFFERSSTARWQRDGVLHIYLVAPPAVTLLAEAYQQALADRAVSNLPPQPPKWLHMTVERFNQHRDDLDDLRLTALCNSLRAELAEVPAFSLQVGPALPSAYSISLDAVPDEPWLRLRHTVRRAAVTALGETAVNPLGTGGRPHVTIAFCTGPVAIEPHLSALNHVREGRAEWTVAAAHLVAVHQHADAGTYSWDTLAEIPLG